MVKDPKHAKNADYSADIGEGTIQHLTFNPSKNFADGNVILFGITANQQGRRLIIITKIYEEERRKEIIDKLGIMVKVMMHIVPRDRRGVDMAYIVDQKDILAQISKHKINGDKLSENITQEQDVTVETPDLITGEMVPVEFSMKLLRMEKYEINKREKRRQVTEKNMK